MAKSVDNIGACFVAGTKVQCEGEEKNIEDISAGDYVYACNTETGETGLKRVVRTFEREVNEIIHVTVDGETIDTTAFHPFYVEGYGFKPAGELTTNDCVRMHDGTIAQIEAICIEHLDIPVKVYNFEVEDWHNYFVSRYGVLVHNRCETDNAVDEASYYEYKALKQQGYNSSESYDLMKQFRNGVNPNDEFVFHFTSYDGGKGIIRSNGIKGSSSFSLAGSGVYAGDIPKPS